MLKGGAIEKLSPDVLKLLDIADNNSERLVHLINDILDIERIEAGKIEFNMAALNLNDLVVETIESNTLYGKEHKVDFILVNTIPDAKVNGDADRLSQILTNLLSNAAKFSAGSDRVEVSISPQNDSYRVSVIDHGIGITPEFRKQIFQKFAQSDATDARQKGGSGLGLNISKSIIKRHDGTIDFESTPDEGSEFYFELPSYGQQNRVSIASQLSDSAPHILVCEDDIDTAHLLQLMLQGDGYQVDVAYDAAQTKKMLKQKTYAALTVDINLPDQDGISLIKELREIPATKHLPIVVVSVMSREGISELSGNAVNIVDWLQKPIDQNLLKTHIKKALKQKENDMATILHVEDDPDILQIVSNIIGNDARIVPAQSIAIAQKALQQQEFDLVILDLALPDGSGENLLSLMRRKDDTLIPVIVFSANEISKSLAENIEIVLTKSNTTNEQLLKSIHSVINI